MPQIKLAPCIQLNNGLQMPLIGIGTYKSKPGEVEMAIKDAIDIGYRHIDTAYAYENEPNVGAAIKEKIGDGSVKRSYLFVVTKLWNTHHNPFIVVPVLRKQLEALQLDYVDLYLMHWPMAFADTGVMRPLDASGKLIPANYDYVETYKAMEACVDLGLARSIGVSNFNSAQLQRLLDHCTIKPVVNQVESHPWLNQDRLNHFCNSRGVVLTAHSPLGSPIRSSAEPDEPKLADDVRIQEIARKHSKSPVQVALRYQVQRGIACIPRSINRVHLEENFKIFDFELTSADMDILRSLDKGSSGRRFLLSASNEHEDYPFRHDGGF